MRAKLRLAASLLAIAAVALIAGSTVATASPHTTYTCTKTKHNGGTDVRVSVPENAVSGLTNAGFTCVAEPSTGDDQPAGDDQPTGDDQPAGGGETEDGGADNRSTPENLPAAQDHERSSFVVTVEAPSESRSLFCSTHAAAESAKGGGAGIALNLPDSQGALLVEQGLVTPAIFYEGIGASCDLLPGFTYSGTWVDHVGDVVSDVAVYPYFVPATN